MGFIGFVLLAVGGLLLFAATQGIAPFDVLRAFLRGDPMPTPNLVIDASDGQDVKILKPLPPKAKLMRPVTPWRISSPFGPRWGLQHNGVDIPVPVGTPVHAAAGGRVEAAGSAGTAGIRIRLAHSPDIKTVYMHLSRTTVVAGQNVMGGQVIGYSGNTGQSTGPHLHFEVHDKGKPVNPIGYV